MSQIHVPSASEPPPPEVPLQFTVDVGGPSVPVANSENLLARDSIANNDNGIRTNNDVSGSATIYVEITNRTTGTVTTANATLTTIITFAMGATPGTFVVEGNVVGFNASTPSSGVFTYIGGYRTDGASATELGTEFHDDFKDVALSTADISLAVSGNNILLQVTGMAGLSINWNALLTFRQVS